MTAPDSPLAPLLGRTLVLAAHPDDEAAGCGLLLQRIAQPAVAFLTDGAPRDAYFWRECKTREEYAELRRSEARAALALVGARPFFCEDIVDQELFRYLEAAQRWLAGVVAEFRPQAIVAPAFEGGHPDHDAANVLAFVTARRTQTPVWEFPCYHRSVDGALVHQAFRTAAGNEFVLSPAPGEWDCKLRMYAAYGSQREVLQHFTTEAEPLRPLLEYDYAAPPHPGVLNYEAWQWGIAGSEVAQQFEQHLRRHAGRTTAGASSHSH
jgi:LmbE family N-acetylglucosaminyl deacetylase